MRISDILKQKGGDVVTIDGGRTVHDAICTLNQHRIGALVVTADDGKVRGIITERDILRACGEYCGDLEKPLPSSRNPFAATVGDVMTADPIVGAPHDSLAQVMEVMTKNRVRHLPILEGGGLVGIISIGDVVNAHVEETEYENVSLRDYITGVTFWPTGPTSRRTAL
jgi:CBS domain-containing protein